MCLSILIIYLLDKVFKLRGEFEESLLGVKAGLRSFIRPFLQLQFGGNQIIFVWCSRQTPKCDKWTKKEQGWLGMEKIKTDCNWQARKNFKGQEPISSCKGYIFQDARTIDGAAPFSNSYKGSFSEDDGDGSNDGNKDVKSLLSKTTTLIVHHASLYLYLPSLHD